FLFAPLLQSPRCIQKQEGLTRSLHRTRAGDGCLQFGRHWPPASVLVVRRLRSQYANGNHFPVCLPGAAYQPLPRRGVTMSVSLNSAVKALAALALVMAVNAISLHAEIIYWPLTALDLAKQRGTSINCVDNLKQIVLAARLWSS